jgi:hypothetical protein
LKKGAVENIDKDLAFKFFMSSAKLGNTASMTEVDQCYCKRSGKHLWQKGNLPQVF